MCTLCNVHILYCYMFRMPLVTEQRVAKVKYIVPLLGGASVMFTSLSDLAILSSWGGGGLGLRAAVRDSGTSVSRTIQ